MSPQPPDSASRRPTTSWLGVVGLLALVALVGAGAWWFYKTEPVTSAPPPVLLSHLEPDAGPGSEGAPDAAEAEPTEPLPPVDQSDGFVREQAARISADPQVQLWLKTPGVLRRMVAGVADLADAESPRGTLSFLAPQGEFPVVEHGGKAHANPKGYGRYDKLGHAVDSVDAKLAVATLKLVEPLCNSVWKEIAAGDTTFRGSLRTAMSKLATAKLEGMDEPLVLHGALWAYADPAREGRSALEKQLMRMGPENAARVQNKARELDALLAGATPAPEASPPTSEAPRTGNASP